MVSFVGPLADSPPDNTVREHAPRRYLKLFIRLGFGLIVVVVLSGCESAKGLEGAPQAEFHSSKSVNEMASCVSSSWSSHPGLLTPIVQPRDEGVSVILPHPHAGVDAVALIQPGASGTRISYSERMPSLSPAWMKDGVSKCL